MRTKLAIVLALAAIAALVPTASAITKPQVFSLLDVEQSEVAIDPGSSETEIPRVGARFGFTDVLYRWAGTKRGARVGRIEGFCTFLKVDLAARAVTVYCVASFYLPAGQVFGAAFLRFAENGSPNFRIAVTGGIGAYANARGFIKASPVGGEDSGKTNLEFHLTP